MVSSWSSTVNPTRSITRNDGLVEIARGARRGRLLVRSRGECVTCFARETLQRRDQIGA